MKNSKFNITKCIEKLPLNYRGVSKETFSYDVKKTIKYRITPFAAYGSTSSYCYNLYKPISRIIRYESTDI